MKLTEKQKRFIDYYIETGNQTEAARLAGYKQPHVQGAQNLEKLRPYIDERLKELEEERIADAREVMRFLTAAMRGEIKEEVVVVESVGDFQSEARIVKKEVSAKERIKAAELLAKRYGLLIDKQQVDVHGAVQIVDDVPKGDE